MDASWPPVTRRGESGCACVPIGAQASARMSGARPVLGVAGTRWARRATVEASRPARMAAARASLLMSCLIGRALLRLHFRRLDLRHPLPGLLEVLADLEFRHQ